MRNKPTEMFELFKQLIPQNTLFEAGLMNTWRTSSNGAATPIRSRKEWYPLLDQFRGRIDSGDEALFRTRLIEEVLLSQQEEDLSERLEHLDYPSAVAEHGPSLARDAHPLGRFERRRTITSVPILQSSVFELGNPAASTSHPITTSLLRSAMQAKSRWNPS